MVLRQRGPPSGLVRVEPLPGDRQGRVGKVVGQQLRGRPAQHRSPLCREAEPEAQLDLLRIDTATGTGEDAQVIKFVLGQQPY